MVNIEEIKKRVSITEIYPKRLDGNRGHCALHDNTSSPSFIYYPENETWCCFSCGTGGDVINLYAHINNLTYGQALRKLCLQYKIDLNKEDLIHYKHLEVTENCLGLFANVCHERLLDNGKLYEEIKIQRGFTDELMKEYKIGLYDEKVQEWIESNFTEKDRKKIGFQNDKGNWYFKKRVVYPYFNHNNKPTYFIYRLIDEDPDFNSNAKYIKHHKTKLVQEELFGINTLSKFRDKPLIITEGITDALSVIQYGHPCLSPVTIKFKDLDIAKILQYAKRFNEIIIINDTETSNKGLEGAEKTLRILLQSNLNGFISIIPNEENLDKIDMNDFLKKKGQEGLEYLIEHKIEGFEYFINKIDQDTSQQEIEDLMILIPEKDILRQKEIFKQIKKHTDLNIGELKKIYKERIKEENFKIEKKKSEETRIRKKNNVNFETFEYKGFLIENREDGLWKVRFEEESGEFYEEQVLLGSFELIHKMKYLSRDYFSYYFRGSLYNTQSPTLILIELKNYLLGGELGKDILKIFIDIQSKNLEYKEVKTIMGFDNGWVLPFLEEENDYKILIYTDSQRRVYRNCREMIKEYPNGEAETVLMKVGKFIQKTQIQINKRAIIIGWAMASVFKLPILKYFSMFPGLMLQGDRQSGKTYFTSFWTVDFFGAWKHYLSGASIKTEARCEDFLATSTFPIHLDELEFVKYPIIEILKSTLTGIHDYIRKLTLLEDICKPEVAPFCITTNEPPRPFLDPALNSKMIVLNFIASEIIKDDPNWIELYNFLKEMKLFSFVYNYTKTWKNKDVIDQLKEIERETTSFNKHSRLKKKYIIIKFGLRLFKQIFHIDLEEYLDPNLLESSERLISENLLDNYIEFCKEAINFEEDYDEEKEYGDGRTYIRSIKGKHPKYLTCKLLCNDSDYVFTQKNLRDFNEFIKENYNLKKLGLLLNEAIRHKNLIVYERCYLGRNQIRAIRTSKELFEKTSLEDI